MNMEMEEYFHNMRATGIFGAIIMRYNVVNHIHRIQNSVNDNRMDAENENEPMRPLWMRRARYRTRSKIDRSIRKSGHPSILQGQGRKFYPMCLGIGNMVVVKKYGKNRRGGSCGNRLNTLHLQRYTRTICTILHRT